MPKIKLSQDRATGFTLQFLAPLQILGWILTTHVSYECNRLTTSFILKGPCPSTWRRCPYDLWTMIPARCCCSRWGLDASFLFCSDPYLLCTFCLGFALVPASYCYRHHAGSPHWTKLYCFDCQSQTHSFATIPIRCDFLSCTQGQGLGTRNPEVSRAGQDILDNGTATQCFFVGGLCRVDFNINDISQFGEQAVHISWCV